MAANIRKGSADLPPKAVEDLKYFAKRAKEGSVLGTKALIKYLGDNHAVNITRQKLHSAMRRAGVEPWFST